MAFDSAEIGMKNDGILCEVHACLRVSIGGVHQMITRLAEKSIHAMKPLCFRRRFRFPRDHAAWGGIASRERPRADAGRQAALRGTAQNCSARSAVEPAAEDSLGEGGEG